MQKFIEKNEHFKPVDLVLYILWNAAIVGTLEIGFGIACGAIFWQFVAIVATIILAIAEQPFRYASVVRLSGTSLPAGGAVALTTHVRRFIGIVTAIVIEIAHPQFGNASSIFACEFSLWIARFFN